MKIYQLIEYSLDYGCLCTIVIGSYMKKERCEEELVKAKAKEKELKEQSEKCEKCPFQHLKLSTLNILLKEYHNYCSKLSLHIDTENDEGDCVNHYIHWEDIDFEIKEVEVEE